MSSSELGSGGLQERFFVLQELTPVAKDRSHARTFLALDKSSLEEVALVLPAGNAGDREELFTSQLDRAQQAPLPHQPRLLEGGHLGHRTYVASEFVAGITLERLLEQTRITTEVALHILRVLGEAVASLHGQGFCHGDIHARNVLISPRGVVTLVGFIPAPFGSPSTTRSAEASVRRYAAPEALESGKISPVSDIYSLGLLAYQLFTGRALLPRASVERTRKNQVEVQRALDKVSRVTRSIPIELSNVIRSMIHIDPGRRPRFGLELLGALGDLLPENDSLECLETELSEEILVPSRRQVTRLIRDTQGFLQAKDATAAAAAARRAADLSGLLLPEEQQVIGKMLRRIIWRAFPTLDSSMDNATERGYTQAILLQVFHGATALGDENLRNLAGFRLATQDDPHPVLADILPAEEDRSFLAALKPRLVRRLFEDQINDEELLSLATITNEFRPRQNASRARICSDLKRCFQFHSSPGTAQAPSNPGLHSPPQRDTDILTVAPLGGGPISAVGSKDYDSQVESSVSEIQVPSDVQFLSELSPTWVEGENSDALLEIVLDAVFETRTEEEEEAVVARVPNGRAPIQL